MRAKGIFALQFALIFSILIAPWPGQTAAYGAYFRTIGQDFFDTLGEGSNIQFSADSNGSFDTAVMLSKADDRKTGRSWRRELDSRSIGWIPTALVVALVLATGLPWRRRLGALLAGVALTQAFILFSVLTWVWDYSSLSEYSAGLGPTWHSIAAELDYTFLDQLGISFSAPVLIWALVTFRKQDARHAC
jgi:hypothetical protein